MMMASKSYSKHPTHKALYDALIESLFMDEDDMDRAVVEASTQTKQKNDDEGQDPPPNSEKAKKRQRTKDAEPSKKSSTSKETAKGKTPSKNSKTGKSISVNESVQAMEHEVSMDVEEPVLDDVANNADEPQGDDTWFNEMVNAKKPPLTFDELMSTPIDFTAFAKNHLKLGKITRSDLLSPVFNLLKGTCKSCVELEYNIEECYRALTDQLDWTNPEVKVAYDKDVVLGITYWGPLRQLFYIAQNSQVSNHDVFSTMKNLSVISVKVEKRLGYGYLEEIVVRRANQKLYKFKEDDFSRLHLYDIEDMLLLLNQHKLFNLGAAGKDDNEELGSVSWWKENRHGQTTVVEDKGAFLKEENIKNRRDLPRDIPLDRIKVLRCDTKGVKVRMRIMQTKTELTLEQTPQGVTDEVLSPTHYLRDLSKTYRVMLFSIHSDEWKSFQCQHHTALRSVLTEPVVNPTKHGRMTKPYSSTSFIADCFIADSYKDKDGDTSFQQKSNESCNNRNEGIRLWQLRLFLFLRAYQSRVWDPLFRELSLSVLFFEVPVAPEVGWLQLPHLPGALTARKSVRPLPSHRLALRYTSHHLDHFTFESSSSHSSSGHSISGHSLSGHTPPDTTDVDSSTPPRFVHPSLARTPRCSEAYLRWKFALLSTMYLLTTSESPAGDSSFESSAGPSRKRCRSPIATVISSIHATRALVPSYADLLPPRKRFRDSISPKDSVEEDINTDGLEDIKADATAIEVAVDRDVEAGIDACIDMEVDVGIDVEDEVEDEVKSSDRGTIEVGVDVVAKIDIHDAIPIPDAVERLEQVEKGLQDIYDHVIKIPLQRIEDIETGQRELESRSLITGGERASLLEQVASLERSNARLRGTMMMERARADRFRRRVRFMEGELRRIRRFYYYDRMRFRRLETYANMTITRSGMTPEAIEELINRRVEEALAAYEATHAANSLEAKSQSPNGSDDDNGNGGNENGGNGNPNKNNRDAKPVARECTYQDFMKCQPLNFKGTKGVVGLIRWFEKIEIVFHISNYPEKYQVKYATCTLLNSALAWWNSHKRTIGAEAAFAMSWRELMKLMAEVYCPRNEIQKMESELWNLTVKNNDLASYTKRFQELTMMYTKMVPEEEDRVEKFIRGLPDNIQGNVIAAEPTKLQDVVRIANNLMDQKLKGYAVKNAENKRRLEVN
ncbi:reverse transcriptase domain-containing protein [Tanacetum coccineum]|uniref:Reverse transcriptase domain-containing protein n=1 Tax=Tanacetum coccineum TaxID=301880 RepID=A0ABQ5HQN1_9ASTR